MKYPELPPGVSVYLIVILPTTNFPLWRAVKSWQREFSQLYDSHSAKNKPPHITLVESFDLHLQFYQELRNALQTAASQVSRGNVSIKDFDHFGTRTNF